MTADDGADLEIEALGRRVADLSAEVARLKMELAGEKKANALLLAGMESVTELYDGQKHRVRELEGLNRSLAERVAAQAELLSRRAERLGGPLGPSNGNQTDPREGGGGEGRTQTQPGTPTPALPRP
jgi:hypothetical protein